MRINTLVTVLSLGLGTVGIANDDADKKEMTDSKAEQEEPSSAAESDVGDTEAKDEVEDEATSETAEASETPATKDSSDHPSLATECKLPDAYRKVWIEYGSTSGDNCQVHYIRDKEPAKVLWTAANDPGFCVEKAKGLISGTLSTFTCTEVN